MYVSPCKTNRTENRSNSNIRNVKNRTDINETIILLPTNRPTTRIQTAADMRYLHDLNVQISQNRRSVSVSKQLDRDLCNQHFDTFETFWGRPGHGARGDKINKLKLDNLLYGASESA
ncbi:LOW QUALITY PROTEIN: uncharacterized protein LOC122621606 [Drosophila teissieri]|uniref:LOW QUALITY PROTEIN: uncharacterized protein LOC122621606 n=1 Tax=Drosophila teissieri TaxID=7243 RepID=UPI001CBA0FAB|nr:LOW QUALITY PROTEIN: uncharacterized protein LOC122621606 [Drosophila teissieri]